MHSLIPLSQLPFSQACENNKSAILTHLTQWFNHTSHVLEIGSGTGQHCTYFAQKLGHLHWHPSDQAGNLINLQARLNHFELPNLSPAIALDVQQDWPIFSHPIDAIFTANTLHIMSKPLVEAFFAGCGKHVAKTGGVAIYGPFKYSGKFTSDSNQQFDHWLKEQNPLSGVRDIEWIHTLAQQQGLTLQQDITMPANNRMLYFSF
ncbi:DUF938 domain-containing protein [Shewanella sp.]|uniref:DUF938 domain-containing protein n=1 Tax=Shewanella sp. TaxID=50422 RepID=UPI004048BC3F